MNKIIAIESRQNWQCYRTDQRSGYRFISRTHIGAVESMGSIYGCIRLPYDLAPGADELALKLGELMILAPRFFMPALGWFFGIGSQSASGRGKPITLTQSPESKPAISQKLFCCAAGRAAVAAWRLRCTSAEFPALWTACSSSSLLTPIRMSSDFCIVATLECFRKSLATNVD